MAARLPRPPAHHLHHLDAKIWSANRADEGWRAYQPGVYDITTPTGGHHDHIHVSIAP